jgi:hypothetical protein
MYLCVITYQYDDRIVEIPGPPTSKQLAIAALSREHQAVRSGQRTCPERPGVLRG